MPKILTKTKNTNKNDSKVTSKSRASRKRVAKNNPLSFVPALVLLISAILLGNFSSPIADSTKTAFGKEIGNMDILKVASPKSLILDLDFGGKSYSSKNPQKIYNLVDRAEVGTLGMDDQSQESDPYFDPNGYFSFDGKAQMMNLDAKNAPKSDFSYEMWVRAKGNFELAYAVSTQAGDYQKSTAGIKIKDSYWWTMGINDGGMVYIPFPDKTVDESWHYVVATRKDQVLTIYLDGVPAEVTRSINKYSLNNDIITIGAVRQGDKYSEFFKGDIAQVRIYARALTNDEVLDNLKQTKPNFIK